MKDLISKCQLLSKGKIWSYFWHTLFSKQGKNWWFLPLPGDPSEPISSATGVPPTLWGILMHPLIFGHSLPLWAKIWALGLSLGHICCIKPSEWHPRTSCQAATWELILWVWLVRHLQSQGSKRHLPQGWNLKLMHFLHCCSSVEKKGKKG